MKPLSNLALAKKLIQDEIFDLGLYKALDEIAAGDLKKLFAELIPIETKHVAFWQDFFKTKIEKLNFWQRLKLALIVLVSRIFGEKAIHLVVEAIEVYGVQKYLMLWETYRLQPLGTALKTILEDEFRHEDRIVTEIVTRRINPEKIRNIFLGFNDGLVEILGAVSGFFAAFQDVSSVLIAGSTVAVAGSLSMAAGAFVASSSENEVKKIEEGKRQFLNQPLAEDQRDSAITTAAVVGVFYFLGAMVPILPVLLGSRNMLAPFIASAGLIALVSLALAFLSGMSIKKRIAMNLAIIALAVSITYAIGAMAKQWWGIAI